MKTTSTGGYVTLKNEDNCQKTDFIIEFIEYEDEIRIKTNFIDTDKNVKRGWVGDLTYTAICENNFTYKQTYKDVLLKRVQISSEVECFTVFEYVFLKN